MSNGAHSWRVLLVEDDPGAARMLAQMLREDGYDVEVAPDGAAALARLTRAPMPDALIADYKLPDADGLAVAAYARAQSPGMFVMIATSYPELVARRELPLPWVLLAKPLAYGELTRELERARNAGLVASTAR